MAVKKSAMHCQRNRTENAGGQRFAGDWCHYAGARVHGGKHVSGPENQEQHAGNDQRHEDKEVGDCSDLHVSEPFAWVVMEDAIKNRQGGFDQPGHGVGDAVHSGLRFLALWLLRVQPVEVGQQWLNALERWVLTLAIDELFRQMPFDACLKRNALPLG